MNRKSRELNKEELKAVTGGGSPSPSPSSAPPCEYRSCTNLTACPRTAQERRCYNCANCPLKN